MTTHNQPPKGEEMSEGKRMTHMTLDQLQKADAEITAALKGPMTNLDRALLVADRKDLRAAIAKAEQRS